ncbi:MAG: DUF3181 family protein [Spirulina sp. SIO3F2]|nr:DUF3181 family protein [Spirulina sp. SIO3F2]
MANSIPAQTLEALAADIGQAAYIDVAKWHLYLNDAKLHTTVAEQVYPLLVDDELTSDSLARLLAAIPVAIGGGQRTVPLVELVPERCQRDLMNALEDFKDQL